MILVSSSMAVNMVQCTSWLTAAPPSTTGNVIWQPLCRSVMACTTSTLHHRSGKHQRDRKTGPAYPAGTASGHFPNLEGVEKPGIRTEAMWGQPGRAHLMTPSGNLKGSWVRASRSKR
jgi:hypothetical protein